MIVDGRLVRSLKSLRALPSGGRRAGTRPPRRQRARIRPLTRRTREVPAATGRRRRARIAAVIVVVAALLAGGWLWVRDSSLVSVRRVTVTGLSGPDAGPIREALTVAARGMTTLDVHVSRLQAAVSPYAVVKGLQVSTDFPHGLTIHVSEQLPVAVVMVGKRRMPIAADGTVLHDVPLQGPLAVLPLRNAPGGSRITDAGALVQLSVLGATPSELLTKIAGIKTGYWHGIVLTLRQGPELYFGAPTELRAKWRAIVAVLDTPQSAGASYIDVTDPRRPAAGAPPPSQTTLGTAVPGATATGQATLGTGVPGATATPGQATAGPAVPGATSTSPRGG